MAEDEMTSFVPSNSLFLPPAENCCCHGCRGPVS
jgi:hypothetical protein